MTLSGGQIVATGTQRSVISQVADNIASNAPLDLPTSSPLTMKYTPVTQPIALSAITADYNPKTWYYIKLQGTGASNHLGRTLLVLALATSQNTAAGKAAINVSSENQFAAISLCPNGDVSMMLDVVARRTSIPPWVSSTPSSRSLGVNTLASLASSSRLVCTSLTLPSSRGVSSKPGTASPAEVC
jgi:hypothetical protein